MSAEQTNPSQAEIEARMDARAKEYQQRVDELRATQRVSSETGKILFPAQEILDGDKSGQLLHTNRKKLSPKR